ncbi:hypothetical protein [Burkholderia ubonensis]|uniref:hypothetical protein n=1 Tax=Burkholderia ubonensis TaxID=101571 RepID=UPI00076CC77E|nr:hypothetical protein [Burkholderia ubonensis]KVQ09545.1 hypothetical protein WK00_06860 [Burkholderia ubonensis]
MLREILIVAACVLALSVAHAAVDVRHSEGVEMITGRRVTTVPPPARTSNTAGAGPSQATRANVQQSPPLNARADQQKGGAAGMAPLRSVPEKASAEDGRLPIRDNVSFLPDGAEQAGGDGMPEDGAAPVRKRLRVTEAVLQDQIAAYNRALLEETPPEKLAPLEEAISRTLDQIDVLVRNTRVPQP